MSFPYNRFAMNLGNIEHELNRMKAETMGDSGKKLEILSAMVKKEQSFQGRTSKIIGRIDRMLESKVKRKNHVNLKTLRSRLQEKIEKSRRETLQMMEKRDELFHNLVLQREAMGLTDHSWIQDYYMK